MAPKRQVQFEDAPTSDATPKDLESPSRRKSKAKAAAKTKAAPNPPANPPPVMPRPKKPPPPPSDRLTWFGGWSGAGAAPALPPAATTTARKTAAAKTAATTATKAPAAAPRAPATPKRATKAAAPTKSRVKSPVRRVKARSPVKKKKAPSPRRRPTVPQPRFRLGQGPRAMQQQDGDDAPDDDEDKWEGVGGEEELDEDEFEQEGEGEDTGDIDMDDDEYDGYVSPLDDIAGRDSRSTRYNRPAHLGPRDDDEDLLDFEQPREAQSPVHKKQQTTNPNWDRFVPGRVVDPKLATIPECVKAIVNGGFYHYLPLHFFAPEILKGGGESSHDVAPGRPLVSELDADVESYMMWSKKALAAFKVLGVPDNIIDMFDSHFTEVQTREDFRDEFEMWRLYDYRQRSLVKGDTPADISVINEELLRQCRSVVTSQLNAKMRAAMENARRPDRKPAAASTSQSATSRNASSSTKDTTKPLKYSRCLICGSSTHTYNKDVTRDDCKTKWLSFDKLRGAWKTPDTRALLCWAWNSAGGCKKPKCRFDRHGHRCSLCGGDHGTHDCQP
ncbi:hypothetical protein EXIGLDRAFT_697124 [Exidia glandulosa HHB12029]|uniref:C3H1-type domain-containing protein n=1 Tax=Exidia glandulosa HHB12029 TaxID=1314781 RepID=A0A165N1E7_EXIGL|nr:hypothetical protein EXIGLDRAFT_697124 [Exidia glandulosa HHB12029]